ncbi:MAG TPA: ROK family protein [Jatrophihabitans sp.]|jgi:glucokinase
MDDPDIHSEQKSLPPLPVAPLPVLGAVAGAEEAPGGATFCQDTTSGHGDSSGSTTQHSTSPVNGRSILTGTQESGRSTLIHSRDEAMAAVSGLGVLDVGGTHATAAHIDSRTWRIEGTPQRADIDAHAAADAILDAIAAPARGTQEPMWAIAMPDPFDYDHGIGRFHDVGKFESLDGVDMRAGLAERLDADPRDLHFCNDADAFTVGEWVAGAGRGADRVMGLTLGTGVGSGWVDGGRVIDPGVPKGGRAHQLQVNGAPLEESMSRRAIRRAYAKATGDRVADVREIAEHARAAEPGAVEVLAHAVQSLGRALAGPIRDFGAEVIVVGGSMSASWGLFEPWFREGAGEVGVPPVRIATDPDAAPLIGAAYVAVTTTSR